MKVKTKIVGKQYFNDNTFWLIQVWERNCFRKWITVGVASSMPKALELESDFKKEFGKSPAS